MHSISFQQLHFLPKSDGYICLNRDLEQGKENQYGKGDRETGPNRRQKF